MTEKPNLIAKLRKWQLLHSSKTRKLLGPLNSWQQFFRVIAILTPPETVSESSTVRARQGF